MAVFGPSTIVNSASRTVSGSSGALSLQGATQTIGMLINVTAATGTTPTLDLSVQWSNDGVAWAPSEDGDQFAQVTSVKASSSAFTRKGAFMRVVWTIGGTTPNFTFTVSIIEMT